MRYKTLEVELEDGRVSPLGAEVLPAKASALLTLLEKASIESPPSARSCAELADRWPGLEKLPPDEANAFADDIERARDTLSPLKPKWD